MGSGSQIYWKTKLFFVAFLVVSQNPQESSCFDEIVPNTFRVLKDLPAVGRALKKTIFGSVFRSVFQPSDESSARSANGAYGDDTETYCFGEIGCISTTQDFYHLLNRPINLAPSSREEINVSFRISSKEDPVGVVVPGWNVQKARESSFKPFRKTKVIIHGFLNGRDMPFLEEINRAYLRHYDVNTVWVDWTDGSIALYNKAVANARVVGLEIAHFINWLRDNMGLNPGDVHLIGHSLGSHISGYAGERIPGLGRITGLDPAEPFFQHMPRTVRLDPSDAQFVDVIHTDAESILNIGQGFGLRQPIGHLDFYPNNGEKQPGCTSPALAPLRWLTRGIAFTKVWHAVDDALGCNHKRAAELFSNSIEASCPFMTFQCDSYNDYEAGKCVSCGANGDYCSPMGEHADSWAGVGKGLEGVRMYSSTAPGPQYCLYHYEVSIDLGDLPGTGWDRMGKLYTGFITNAGQEITFDLTSGRPKMFTSQGKYTFFMKHSLEIGDIREALVKWVMSRRGSRSAQASLNLRRLSIRNVDTAPIRSRGGRSSFGDAEFHFCSPSGGGMTVNDQQVINLKPSANCSF